MSFEVGADKAICSRCGTAYGKRKGNFPVSYAILHRGLGYLPICRNCLDSIFNAYLAQCNDPKMAVRQICRKLDLYWNESIYDSVVVKSTTRSVMTQYLARINSTAYAGKSYDNTLSNEGTLWSFGTADGKQSDNVSSVVNYDESKQEVTDEDISDDIKAFWGSGLAPSMYLELEQRRSYWMSRPPFNVDELDVGAEALLRQICSLELDINRDRAAGRSVDKSINAFNTLIGSINLKPAQKRQEDLDSTLVNTPLGVWLYKYENERPLPEVDEELKDVNGIKRYIFTWMGHLCKMLGIKNTYSKMYEDEIARYRVERPEYDGDDDETMMQDILLDGEEEGGDDS